MRRESEKDIPIIRPGQTVEEGWQDDRGALLDGDEVMQALRINEQGLESLIVNQKLPAYRYGGMMRFRQRDVDALLAKKLKEEKVAGIIAGLLMMAGAAAAFWNAAQNPVMYVIGAVTFFIGINCFKQAYSKRLIGDDRNGTDEAERLERD